jgi:hypothetical protein
MRPLTHEVDLPGSGMTYYWPFPEFDEVDWVLFYTSDRDKREVRLCAYAQLQPVRLS